VILVVVSLVGFLVVSMAKTLETFNMVIFVVIPLVLIVVVYKGHYVLVILKQNPHDKYSGDLICRKKSLHGFVGNF
jgi:hypothetical protein